MSTPDFNMTNLTTTDIMNTTFGPIFNESGSEDIINSNHINRRDVDSENSEALEIFGFVMIGFIAACLICMISMCIFIICSECLKDCYDNSSFRNRVRRQDSEEFDTISYSSYDSDRYLVSNVFPGNPKNLILKETSTDKINFENCINCTICLEEIQRDEKICQLPCGHVFHQECISNWHSSDANYTRSCPLCRDNMKLLEVVVHNI